MVSVHSPGNRQLRYVVAEMTGGEGFTAFLEVPHSLGEMTFFDTTAHGAEDAVIQFCARLGISPPVCVSSFSESSDITDEYRAFLGKDVWKEHRGYSIQMNVVEDLGYFHPNARYSLQVPPTPETWVKVSMAIDGSVDPRAALRNGYEFTTHVIDSHLAKASGG